MSSSAASPPVPQGPGSVSGAPNLPEGFTGTFTSRYIDTGDLRQHVVTGGDGPPILLVHGWPQTWYAWRLVMPALARDFSVVAPDQRGTGLSGKPADGYDTGTLAGDLVALMDALGHQRFAVAGHDTGMWIGYALAADHPDRVNRLAVAETPLPGLSPSPPLFRPAHLNNALWHFAFNRLAEVNDQLVAGREDIYFGWQFASKAAKKLPDYAVRHYVGTLAASPEALHASFAIYRALDTTIAQNQQRKNRRLTLPVLGIGGQYSLGEQVADTMKLGADDVQPLVVPGCAHWVPEEAPEEMLAALAAFLAPYPEPVNTTIIEVSSAAAGGTPDDLLAVPFFEAPAGPDPGPGAMEAARAVGADLTGMLARQGFRGRPGDAATFVVPGGQPRRVMAVGVGPAGDVDAAAVRDAAQRVATLAAGSAHVAATLGRLGPDRAEAVRAAAEGFLLGSYRVPRAGSQPVAGQQPEPPETLTLLVGSAEGARTASDADGDDELRDGLARGIVTGQMASWVRDLVHAPAGEATPEMLAETIAAQAAAHGAAARIWTAGELAREGFGGVIGVGQGSRNSPRMVEVTHAGPGGPQLAFAGKGITFDSGGLNLKRDPGEISWMRADMAGGAAVTAAVIAAARLALPVPAVAVVPLAENMPGGGALRPGDVLTHRGGRTSEVMDTDSEGRLVVADALGYLAERSPAALIDVATLTDAAGLGPALWAATGTGQELMADVLRAGEVAGEPGWPLPLPDAYRELLSSTAADLRNTPSRGADSTVMAAMFLREFTAGVPWVHIDNGSTAWLEHSTGLWPEGATGSPARALLRFLENRAARP